MLKYFELENQVHCDNIQCDQTGHEIGIDSVTSDILDYICLGES
jgi:hypothetical protein